MAKKMISENKKSKRYEELNKNPSKDNIQAKYHPDALGITNSQK